MTYKATLIVAVLVLMAPQAPPRPEPPPDAPMCTPHGDIVMGVQTDIHPCSCKRMNNSEDCDDPNMDHEDPQCTRYCRKDKCGCPVTCDPSYKQPCQGPDCH